MIATDVVTRCSAAPVFNYISLNSDTPHSLASCHLPPGLSNEKPWLRTKLQYTVTVCRVQPLFTRSLINQNLAVAIKIFNFTKKYLQLSSLLDNEEDVQRCSTVVAAWYAAAACSNCL